MNPKLQFILKTIWYDPLAGFTTGEVLWNARPKEITRLAKDKAEVVEWVESQQVRQVLKQNRVLRSSYRHIVADGPGELQVDLADFQSVKSHQRGKGGAWMLVAIDVFSRRLWTRALRTKEAGDVIAGMEDILGQFDTDTKAVKGSWPPVRRMTTDMGSEFTSKKMTKLLEARSIELYTVDPADKRRGGGQVTGIVDRVIRTIRKLITYV